MYQVLLVDDEPLDLEGLKRLVPWGKFNMRVTAEVTSAFAVLEFLEQRQVDILVTDIKMPIMSGVELAAKLREKYPEMKIIFVSGYDDFQYAKKAINLQASSYILKPINDHELFQCLEQVKDELDQEKSRNKVEEYYHETLPLLRDELLLKWLHGNTKPEVASILENELFKFSGDNGYLAVLELDDLVWKLKQYSEAEKSKLMHKVNRLIIEYMEANQLGSYYKLDNQRIAIILCRHELPENELQKFVNYVSDNSPVSITIGLGGRTADLHEFPRSYRQACELLAAKMFIGKGRVITKQQSELGIKQNTIDLEQKFSKLFAATAKYETVQLHDDLEDLFDYVRTLEDKISVYHFSLYVISKMDAYLNAIQLNLYDILGIDFKDLDEVFDFETVDDIESWLRRKLYAISEHIYWNKQKPNHKLIEEVEKYITEHLSDSITLRNVANIFGFSPNYLGYLFKEQNQENFSDFVIRKRLEKAKTLLKEPTLKIYEVADRVGYNNLTYFSRHFKSRFGMTPGEFQKQI
ncbi:response regulator [Paenibacillus sp. J5C_2022]|uniref:response regulator n=1 Tax=Paenibacillus sp. J5C2022 TaxID=2977129 RepID=UPI0021CEF96E|nr:response regulator [Paenibacillus sp. J5C2022]MCU6710736.1 response regulator [Paenibacillus sp. J5C2022]